MNSFDPAMISFFGRNERQQQIWEWENLAHPPSDSAQYCQFPSFLENAAIANSSFYDCSPSSFPLMAAGSSAGSLYSIVPRKREEDWSGGGIGLNLGQRMYFPTGGVLPVDRLFHRSAAAMYQVGGHVPLCQVEGCKADLTMAKNYHRRHKVCEFHSKSAAVIIAGMHQRFCQQCSRFHILSEFDDAKRSCRKRLADHNRRRRKPRLPAPTSAATSDSLITQESRSTIGTSRNAVFQGSGPRQESNLFDGRSGEV